MVEQKSETKKKGWWETKKRFSNIDGTLWGNRRETKTGEKFTAYALAVERYNRTSGVSEKVGNFQAKDVHNLAKLFTYFSEELKKKKAKLDV